jgi:hypothetical protein
VRALRWPIEGSFEFIGLAILGTVLVLAFTQGWFVAGTEAFATWYSGNVASMLQGEVSAEISRISWPVDNSPALYGPIVPADPDALQVTKSAPASLAVIGGN